jgi:hypothetical protein
MPILFENHGVRRSLKPALEAVAKITRQELNGIFVRGQMTALNAHNQIRLAPISQKTGPFYRHLLPLRELLSSRLGNSYRMYFKLALAHPRQAGLNADKWARAQLQPAIGATVGWLRDWYILAGDGENQWVRNVGSTKFVPGQTVSLSIPLTASPPLPSSKSWRAPAWLFEVSLVEVGIGVLKTEHVPATDSEQRLGTAHTRLLLKGARRVFLWELETVIERARNEETVAAGAIPTEIPGREKPKSIKRRGWQEREKLYKAIQKALSVTPSLQGMAFCTELDKRHAPPLYDWIKSGEWAVGLTWKEAWVKPGLRKKIRRVRQEAQKRR